MLKATPLSKLTTRAASRMARTPFKASHPVSRAMMYSQHQYASITSVQSIVNDTYEAYERLSKSFLSNYVNKENVKGKELSKEEETNFSNEFDESDWMEDGKKELFKTESPAVDSLSSTTNRSPEELQETNFSDEFDESDWAETGKKELSPTMSPEDSKELQGKNISTSTTTTLDKEEKTNFSAEFDEADFAEAGKSP